MDVGLYEIKHIIIITHVELVDVCTSGSMYTRLALHTC